MTDIATPTGASMNRHRSKQDYRTPPDFLGAVERRFGKLSWDLAADDTNHVAPDWFGPASNCNSLCKDWADFAGGSLCFLNPPFNHIEPWAAKCREESEKGARILFLVPASVGSVWYANHVHRRAVVLALNPRLSFDGKAPYPKDCILACYWAGLSGFDVWDWK
jgi:phage N-6-adenine-methyltransferase